MSRLLVAAVLLSTISACGLAGRESDDITVRRYEDTEGRPTPYDDSLGFTYYLPGKGYNVLINQILSQDADEDRIVRVVMHELMNVLVLDHAGQVHYPADMDGTWYLYDGDSRDPYYPVPAAEAAWLSDHAGYRPVKVKSYFVIDATNKAVQRINEAAGAEVFSR